MPRKNGRIDYDLKNININFIWIITSYQEGMQILKHTHTYVQIHTHICMYKGIISFKLDKTHRIKIFDLVNIYVLLFCCSFAQWCPTFCDLMDYSTSGIPVLHHHPQLAQIHVHWLGDAIQPSHPLSSPSPPTFNLVQHPGLFKWVSSSHQVSKVLEFQLQHQSFQWIFRTDFLYDELVGSPCSPRGSQESSPTPQFKNINSSVLTLLYSPTLTSIHDYWKNHNFDSTDLCQRRNGSSF